MRHALVTAGNKGIGLQVVRDLLADGYSVSASYRKDYPILLELKKEYGERIQWIYGDVTKKEEMNRFIKEAYERYGRIDVLINNAGPYKFEKKKFSEYTCDEYDELMNGNVKTLLYLLQQVVPIMRQQKYGRIITYGYQGAQTTSGWMYRSVFAAAKSALASLTKTIAFEEAEHGITVNMVCPGDIIGEQKEMTISQVQNEQDNVARVGRPGCGEDVSRAILFLCNEQSSFITGSILDINGGVDVVNRYLHVPINAESLK